MNEDLAHHSVKAVGLKSLFPVLKMQQNDPFSTIGMSLSVTI